jgi:DNA polymerase III alpha subunit
MFFRCSNTGVYFHKVPTDPFKNVCTIDHKAADNAGYFKLDFLNVSIYKDVRSEDHLQQLMDREPIWDLLQHDEFISKLFHVAEHGDVLKKLKPDTIEKLAAVIAIIRPAKRYLAICTWEQILKEVWIKPENDQYFFKKAHAIAYAHVIVVQMNLLCEQLQKGVDNE